MDSHGSGNGRLLERWVKRSHFVDCKPDSGSSDHLVRTWDCTGFGIFTGKRGKRHECNGIQQKLLFPAVDQDPAQLVEK